MDDTLIIQKRGLINSNSIKQHIHHSSVKEQMKNIAIKYGVQIDLVKDLNRMAHIWNATRYFLEENASKKEIMLAMNELNVQFMIEERADHEVSVLGSGTLSGLQKLHNLNYLMGLVTTASRESYERISNHQDFGSFGKFFKHTVTRDDCNYIKPDPEPINRILDLFNARDFVYVGDSDHDAEACKASDGLFILINTKRYDSSQIDTMNPDAIISNLSELPSILERLLDVRENNP